MALSTSLALSASKLNTGADHSMAVVSLSDRLVNTRENMILLRMSSHRKSVVALHLNHH